MPIHLEILEGFQAQTEINLLRLAAETALKHQSAPEDAELSIVVSNDEQLRQLNQQFLGIDAATDVLSFPSVLTDPESGAPYLGDIIISIQRAETQAQAGGHSLTAELQLLTIHGVLHLLGHDHADPQEKNRMWQSQSEILHTLGITKISLSE